ncbi:hypothetical protein AMTR_s00126p00044930 [Amborella trichopoda]|uniref:Aminotransferase-like plant mobile domain-containing protein n=1 Tax=Amborella trichopoda TaxID=13333 RepID=W1NNA1_AMBTC|nr:hypothetical protein AMTR_s00126p00044930 [Amborella trichopoda]
MEVYKEYRYLPDRVLRQFGLTQPIPKNPGRWQRGERHGRFVENSEVELQDQITGWRNAIDNFQASDANLNGGLPSLEYRQWYAWVFRPRIHNTDLERTDKYAPWGYGDILRNVYCMAIEMWGSALAAPNTETICQYVSTVRRDLMMAKEGRKRPGMQEEEEVPVVTQEQELVITPEAMQPRFQFQRTRILGSQVEGSQVVGSRTRSGP